MKPQPHHVASVHSVSLGQPGSGCELLAWDGRLHDRRGTLTPAGDRARALASYERSGIAGFAELIGDWSLVLHDLRRAAVVLASDYAGTRPLYYTISGNRVLWSRSLGELVRQAGSSRLNDRYFSAFLTIGACAHETPYEGVRSVPPGEAVVVTIDGHSRERFWSLPVDRRCRYRDERDYERHFQHLFREAVAVRLADPGPAVAELSGGLDSSSVVCVAADLIARGEVAASSLLAISYVHPGSIDLPFLETVVAHCHIECVRLSTSDWPMFEADDGAWALPHASVPMQCAAAAIARLRGVRTFLTGQGGDALTGNWIDDSLQVAPLLQSGRLLRACSEAVAWSRACRVPAPTILWRALVAAATPTRCWTPRSQDLGLRARLDGLSLGPRLRRLVESHTACFSDTWRLAPIERRPHFLALAMMLELRSLQPFEPIADLAYTHPFAHRPLVEFLMSIPAHVLCGPGEPRRLMRRSLGGSWPSALRARRSKGLFGRPALRAFGPFATKLLAEDRFLVVDRGWVCRDALVNRLRRFQHGLEENAVQLRQILLVENWLRSRVDSSRHYQSGTSCTTSGAPASAGATRRTQP